ncbi:hypothetical protein C1S86_24370 [Vibrio parahaemolyticus]|uniref:baseplate J/gp47 family protein n=1 Tax=Vibrio parahaemolyticus TaxID=670 RepID=UPI000C87BABF|nr:baseplate J/gp47 family protein [Vibrio parahaemolyticus]PMT73892.1 hypothetical protein C1S97_25290 [Vibrio parahaemolyticus]PMT79092.1 hypothetical protein C1S86_24370 [Vibrio parahaemolyticus]
MAMTEEDKKNFEQVVKNAGTPTTEDEVTELFKQENIDQGSLINNDSKTSPFWRLIQSIVTAPYFWLLNALTNLVLPQSFLKTASGYFVDLYLWSVDLERKEASKAQGYVIFEREADAPEITLPAGFTISTEQINDKTYRLVIPNEVVLPANTPSFSVDCIAEETGDDYNLGGFYYQIPQTTLPGLIRVYNPDDWLTEPGQDKELDDDAKERCRSAYQSVSGWFIDDKYKLIMSEFGGVKTDQIYIEHDAPRGAGTANAYILLDSGIASQPFIDAINKAVRDDGYHGLGDDMLAMSLPEAPQDIVFEYLPAANLTTSESETLKANIEQFIRCAFRENQAYSGVTKTWPQSLFSYSTLNQELRNEFSKIESLYTPNRDFLSGLEIARIGTLTITETPRTTTYR